jgi:histidinol-phosphatase
MVMPYPSLAEELAFAVRMARAAGKIAMAHYQTEVAIHTKDDLSPVTIADRDAEREVRAAIEKQFPTDGILGEEHGDKPGTSGRRWILDPIDGTRTFIHGAPLFGVMVALVDRETPVLGAIYFPALEEMVYAASGQGAWWLPAGHKPTDEPRRARVSTIDRLDRSLFCYTGVGVFDQTNRGGAFDKLRKVVELDRSWGDCYGHMLVATGRAEVMIDPIANLWDCAALQPIVLEAGGSFTNWKGETTIYGGEAISANGKVTAAVLETIKGF